MEGMSSTVVDGVSGVSIRRSPKRAAPNANRDIFKRLSLRLNLDDTDIVFRGEEGERKGQRFVRVAPIGIGGWWLHDCAITGAGTGGGGEDGGDKSGRGSLSFWSPRPTK